MMTKLYTMGFTKKSAEDFFTILGKNNVEKILDIRLNNDSHLSSFARKKHLPFLLERILGCKYNHLPILAPTDKLFQGYKKKTIAWPDYKKRFMALMDERKPENFITEAQLQEACFLYAANRHQNNAIEDWLQNILRKNFQESKLNTFKHHFIYR